MENKYIELLKTAYKMRKQAYTPYSHYNVGTALLCKDGKIFTGCNIENGAFSPTICAERVAFFDAVKNGERDFEAIAIAAGNCNDKEIDYASPCGVCRQVMSEFCDDNFKIVLSKALIGDEIQIIEPKVYTLLEALPFRFNL